MMRDRIRTFLAAVPFVPFEIEMASGSVHRVENHDFVLMEDDWPEIVIEDSLGRTHLLNPMLITSIQYEPVERGGGA
jgi:hypothetical protein